MSDIRVVGSTVPTRKTADDSFISPRATRDGTLATLSYFDVLSQEGRVFCANNGSATTPLTFLIVGANRPDAWLRVPSGTTCLPILCAVQYEAAAGTVTEAMLRSAQNDIGNGTSTAASLGPISTKTTSSYTAGVVCRHLATGDTTAETNPVELFRSTYAFAQATAEGNDPLKIVITRELMGYPVLVGPASLSLLIDATTTQATGFVTWIWAEIPTTAID